MLADRAFTAALLAGDVQPRRGHRPPRGTDANEQVRRSWAVLTQVVDLMASGKGRGRPDPAEDRDPGLPPSLPPPCCWPPGRPRPPATTPTRVIRPELQGDRFVRSISAS